MKRYLAITLLALSCGIAGWWAARSTGRPDPGLANIHVNTSSLPREAKLTSYAPVASLVAPSVVNVFSTRLVKSPHPELRPFLNDPLLGHLFGFGPGRPLARKQLSLGSGVIVTADGYILTNYHVIEGAEEIQVSLAGGDKKKFTAVVVGRDAATDLAVLKIRAQRLPVITFGDSDQLQVGDVVLAVGDPFALGQTVTMGIVSGLRRHNLGLNDGEDYFIQTDAAINPGNSGGALVDAVGRLVGINTAILSGSGGNEGIGFAIPSNLARRVMEQLIQKGKPENDS